MVEDSLDLTDIPPPNTRCYTPKYSKDQRDLLADKMDELLQLGILSYPEDVGVTPAFTSPSMLVPKPGKDEGWRFVTDFTQLNNYIRKRPAISPSIEETKLQIADFKYFVCIDLSQFYFQNAVKKESVQYLGVIHPYKGTLMYTVRPMGLRNSSEIAYERLTRVFGDMQREKRLCRQADALIVGGRNLDTLFSNLREVFFRLRRSNLTIKPSKLVICPRSTTLFGWEYENQAWKPGKHRLNPLQEAAEPTTVKQLRSWLGACKQFTAGLDAYAVKLHPLEQAVAGRASSDKIVWTEDLSSNFKVAKEMLKSMQDIYYPTPEDTIKTYSDFSEESKAIGGRLEFVRTMEDGSKINFHGGFFSACLYGSRQKWLPCEAECLGVKLVLEHFAPVLRESKHQIIHHCDNLPTVRAYERLRQGKFSASARISAFLTTVNTLNVKLVHKAGKDIVLTDYLSRHPSDCTTKRCQVCNFVEEQVSVGDAIVWKVTVAEIMEGKYHMPYLQSYKEWTRP